MKPTITVLITGASPDFLAIYEQLHDHLLMGRNDDRGLAKIDVRVAELKPETGNVLHDSRGVILCAVGGFSTNRPGILSGIHEAHRIEECAQHLGTYAPFARHVLVLMVGSNGTMPLPAALRRAIDQCEPSRVTMWHIPGDNEALADVVRDDAPHVLAAALADAWTDDGATSLRARNDEIAAGYAATAIPTPALMDGMLEMLASRGAPILVHGPPRVGKSTLLAELGPACARRFPHALVIRHFVEAAGDTPDHGMLLDHLLSELADPDEAPTRPASLSGKQERFLDMVQSLRNRRVIIIIDAVDQLCASSQDLRWLPSRLPPGISLVVSATQSKAESVARDRGWRVFPIDHLPPEVDAAMLRRIREGADASLIGTTTADADPDTLHAITEAMLQPGSDAVTRLVLERVLKNARQRHGEGGMLRTLHMLRMVCCSRRGLSPIEMRELSGSTCEECDEFTKGLHPLTKRIGTLITLDHPATRCDAQAFAFADPERTSQEVVESTHEMMGDYFRKHALPERRIEEAPWQLAHAGDRARGKLRAYIEDLETIDEMIAFGREYEILEYWHLTGSTTTMTEACRDAVDEWIARTDVHAANVGDMIQRQLGRARLFNACSQYRASELCLNHAAKLQRDHRPDDRSGLIAITAMRGETLRILGLYDEAIAALEQALQDVRSLPQSDPVAEAQIANDLGLAKGEANRPGALDLLRCAHKLKRRHLGPAHPSTIETLCDIAHVNLLEGQHPAARSLLDKARALLNPAGPDDAFEYESPLLASCLHNLASALNGCNEREEARKLLKHVLDMRERMLGAAHHRTAITRVNLAVWYYNAGKDRGTDGDRNTAYDLTIQADKEAERVLNRDHPDYLIITVNLAQLLQEFDGYDKARKLLLTTLGACRRVLPAHHRITAHCLHNLARLIAIENRAPAEPDIPDLERAERYAAEALDAWRATAVRKAKLETATLVLLGEIQERLGKLEAALDSYTRALELHEAHNGPDNPRANDLRGRIDRLRKQLGLGSAD